MSSVISAAYSEHTHRLALGLEPWDALRRTRIARPIRIQVDDGRVPAPAIIPRRDSCLHALLSGPGLGEHIDLLLHSDDRRFVPRRMRFSTGSAGDQLLAVIDRIRRPTLFPGANYDLAQRCTGLRGRVRRAGREMRWARIAAFLPDTSLLVGRAHGDDRGEFLLVIQPLALAELTDPLRVRIVVSGPAVAPAEPSDPVEPGAQLWSDLPLEVVPTTAASDQVSSGQQLPENYVSSLSASREVDLRLGRIISLADGAQDFEFDP